MEEQKKLLKDRGLEVLRVLGEGAFGRVFQVRNERLGVMAAKIMEESKFEYSEWQAGIQLTRNVQNPFVLRYHEATLNGQNVLILMEYSNMGDLEDVLESKKDIPIPMIRVIMKHILEGLKIMHEKGLIHRDIKEPNILLHSPPGSGRVILKICDFGLVKKQQKGGVPVAMSFGGTPGYFAPELIIAAARGTVAASGKVDIWSAGVILFHLAARDDPFNSVPEMLQPLARPNTIKDDLLWDLLKKMLQVDPNDRISAEQALKHSFFTSKQAMKEISPVGMKIAIASQQAKKHGDRSVTFYDEKPTFTLPLVEMKQFTKKDPEADQQYQQQQQLGQGQGQGRGRHQQKGRSPSPAPGQQHHSNSHSNSPKPKQGHFQRDYHQGNRGGHHQGHQGGHHQGHQGGSPDPMAGQDRFTVPNPMTDDYAKMLIKVITGGHRLTQQQVNSILAQSLPILQALPNIIDVNVPDGKEITVVGDIHGQFFDLQELFRVNRGKPSNFHPYIFTGNYVDFGSFGAETFLILLCFKLAFPQHVHLLRGQHESEVRTKEFGFKNEIEDKYNNATYREFLRVFNALPLCAVINHRAFVVNSGLFSKPNVGLDDIKQINRQVEPESDVGEKLMAQMLYSEPMEEDGVKMKTNSFGCQFGPNVTNEFLNKNNLQLVIRSNTAKSQGHSVQHSGKLTTVFSAPSFVRDSDKGAYLRVLGQNLEIHPYKFSSVQALPAKMYFDPITCRSQ
ncbi:MAG: putative Serine/threonine-protein phosphatase 5 [Streblomastix strix]|uniref:Putative Serine/threonine-protein phosphatase 5 n=1 Tax=Streblomastix strix TaxID=222440 RepID=A0A5J4VQ86_9EUKA|nr:MAG: putative Serine/threonine-protein phosphatase 5 [Streblomastix strix]